MLGGYDLAHRPPPGGAWEYKTAFPTKMKLPGRDLPANDIWQLEEGEFMRVEDYDFILKEGFETFQKIHWERIGLVRDQQEMDQAATRQIENEE